MLEKGDCSTTAQRYEKAVALADFVKTQLLTVEAHLIEQEEKRLTAEKLKAEEEVQVLKAKVQKLEAVLGIQVVPARVADHVVQVTPVPEVQPQQKVAENESVKKPAIEKKKESTKKKEKPQKSAQSDESGNEEINVSRLDLRIGKVISVEKHPDADALYVEKIEVGEDKPRTVVSGLVKFVPIEQIQDRLVIVLCNLKPAKMRGILSEAMLMCASTPEKVEILNPPSGSVPGDRIVCADFPGNPDVLLNPKKKVFEQVAPDLKTNDSCIATYKGCPLMVSSKGPISSESLSGVQIK